MLEQMKTLFMVTHLDDEEMDLIIRPKRDESIFIMAGHGRGNTDYVFWDKEKDAPVWKGFSKEQLLKQPELKSKACLSPQEYVDRFAKYYDPSIDCNVEIYSCYSGHKGERAFGYLVAKELWRRGYTKCRIFGYTRAVTQSFMGGEKGSTPKGDSRRYPKEDLAIPRLYGTSKWNDFRDRGSPVMRYVRLEECRVEFTDR